MEKGKRKTLELNHELALIRMREGAAKKVKRIQSIDNDLDPLKKIQNSGWKSTPDLQLELCRPREYCSINSKFEYYGNSIWRAVKQILTPSIINNIFIIPINHNLDKLKGKSNAKELSYFNHIDDEMFWKFIYYQCNREIVLAARSVSTIKRYISNAPLEGMNETRVKKLTEAASFDHVLVNNGLCKLRDIVMKFTYYGNTSTIDETLYRYTGKDCKDQGAWVKMPNKPAREGFLWYAMCQETLYTRSPIVIDWEPRQPGNFVSPSEAMFNLIQRVDSRGGVNQLLFIGSLFQPISNGAKISSYGWSYTGSVPISGARIENIIIQEARSGLQSGQHRTFRNGNKLLEVYQGPKETSCFLSSGHYSSRVKTIKDRHVWPYKSVLELFLHVPLEYLCEAFKEPYSYYKDIGAAELLKKVTKVDILSPPPNAEGIIVWDKEQLNNLTLEHLIKIAESMKFLEAVKGKQKPFVVERLLQHKATMTPSSKPEVPKMLRKTRQLVSDKNDFKNNVLGPINSGISIHDDYILVYSMLDKVNKDFATVLASFSLRSYGKYNYFVVLLHYLRTAYICYIEREAQQRSNGKIPSTPIDPCFSFSQFIGLLVEEIFNYYHNKIKIK